MSSTNGLLGLFSHLYIVLPILDNKHKVDEWLLHVFTRLNLSKDIVTLMQDAYDDFLSCFLFYNSNDQN